jgi:hypothetical protein
MTTHQEVTLAEIAQYTSYDGGYDVCITDGKVPILADHVVHHRLSWNRKDPRTGLCAARQMLQNANVNVQYFFQKDTTAILFCAVMGKHMLTNRAS